LLSEGEAELSERPALEAHAAECPTCAEALNRSRHLIGALKGALRSPAVKHDDARIKDIMGIITNMPTPQAPERDKSLVFSVCYTLYNSLVVGLMCSIVYFVGFASFFTPGQFILQAETRTALFGCLSIIIGCIFILLPGRSFTAWSISRIRQSAARARRRAA
jgi:anti-sigma factor RsiW